MKKILSLGVVMISFFGMSQVNVPLRSVNLFSDEVIETDTSTWTLTTSPLTANSSTGFVDGVNGFAVQPCSGVIYVLYKSAGVRYLGIYDEATAFIDEIGMFPDQIATISFGAAYDELYAITGNGATTSETLYSVDIATAALTSIATLSIEDDGEAISFSPLTGKLYRWSGWSNIDCVMQEIDPVTLATTNVTLSGYAYNNIGGATYIGGNKFIVSDLFDNQFSIIGTDGVAVGPILDHGDSYKGVYQPLRYISSPNDSLCLDDTTTIYATNGDTHEWFLDGISTGITTDFIDAYDGGDYTCLITIDTCTYFSNTFTLTVSPTTGPSVTITPALEGYLCTPGDSVLLVASEPGGMSQWYENGVAITGETNDSLWVFTGGSVYNMLNTNSFGCSDSASTGTLITAPPVLEIDTAAGTEFCIGGSIPISAPAGASSYAWYLDGVLVSGATTNTIMVDTEGNYTVAATYGTCYDSTSVGVDMTEKNCGIGYHENEVFVDVYPNPSENFVNVIINGFSSSNGTYEVMSVDGKKVMSGVVNTNKLLLDLSELNPGTYFINIQIEGQMIQSKITKI